MKIEKKQLPKSEMELTIEISVAEFAPYIKNAAQKISEQMKIPGFRPGGAPYDIVKQNAGEMAIYERAADEVVSKTIFEAIDQEKLESVGQPRIEISKLAPGNPLIYKAIVSLLPKITLADWRKIKIKRKEIKNGQAEVDKVLKDLQKMQTKEVLVNREARAHDKIVINMDISKDNVPLEGGQTKNHSVYFDEDYYIPGLKDQLMGMKASEEKTFALEFPKDHYQKNFAGKKADFKINVVSVFELTSPEVDEEFAKSLGQKSVVELKEKIKENITEEAKHKEEQRVEIEMLEELAKESKFDDIPDCLITAEARKMIHELEDNIGQQGLKMTDYLTHIKKTEAELMLQFTPEAIKRIKIALATRQIAIDEKVEVSDKEVEEEVEKTIKLYPDTPEIHDQIRAEQSKHYLKNVLTNRKVIALLKDVIVK